MVDWFACVVASEEWGSVEEWGGDGAGAATWRSAAAGAAMQRVGDGDERVLSKRTTARAHAAAPPERLALSLQVVFRRELLFQLRAEALGRVYGRRELSLLRPPLLLLLQAWPRPLKQLLGSQHGRYAIFDV